MKSKLISILTILAIIFLCVCSLFSCKKEAKQHYNEIKYHCYSESNQASFKYMNFESNWVTIRITNHVIDLTMNVKDDDLRFSPQVFTTVSDSLFIGADANGKHLESKVKNGIAGANISLNLIDLK